MGIAATTLYLIYIPESPRWLFAKDFTSKEGIKILNYIARFNRSDFRIPKNAVMDIVGQLLIET